jgi:hypothetical protein
VNDGTDASGLLSIVLSDGIGFTPNEKLGLEAVAGTAVVVDAAGAPNENPPVVIAPAGFGAASFAVLAALTPGLAVSQQGHFACVAWFVTAHVGHFQLPGASCVKRASGFAPLDIVEAAATPLEPVADTGFTGVARLATLALGFAVSQQGHLLCVAWFVTAHVGHFQLPGAICVKRARRFTPLDSVAAAGVEAAASTAGLGLGAFSKLACGFWLFVFAKSPSPRTFGDAGTNANGVSTAPLTLRVGCACTRFGGSRRLGGGENTKRISSTSSSTTFRLPPWSTDTLDAGTVNVWDPYTCSYPTVLTATTGAWALSVGVVAIA